MTSQVYVHIGPHKTGTTFLQQVLAANRQALAESGVLFPGVPYAAQRRAVLTLVKQDVPPADRPDAWDGLAAEIRDWTGERAVISVENLDSAAPEKIERLVRSLSGTEVHVVFTARDYARVIPARWHTHMRNRTQQAWKDYLATVRADAAHGRGLWSGQDPRVVLERWEQHVPRERIHVITVPRSGAQPDILWERFCSVVGLDPASCSLAVPRSNESLGTAETELLRRINARVARRIDGGSYIRWVQTFIAREVLEHRDGQTKFALPASEHAWVRELADDVVRFLEASQYQVTGDLAELRPAPPDAGAVAPDEAADEDVLDAAVDVISGLLVRLDEEEKTKAAAVDGAVGNRLDGRVDGRLDGRAGRMLASVHARMPVGVRSAAGRMAGRLRRR